MGDTQKQDAQELKTAGNDAFARGDWKLAADHFTGAIKLDPTDHVFYSNRSGAYANLARYEDALKDAKKCVELKPDWWKAWSRKGHAEYHLNYFGASERSYEQGLKLNPSEKSLVEGRDKARAAQLGTPMGDMQKLSTAEVEQRLRSGLAKLSEEELAKELGKAGIAAKGKTREEMIELLVKAPQQAAAAKAPKESCCSRCSKRCCPEKKYLTPGEKYLETRRKLLAKWEKWDEAKLKKRLQSLGEEVPREGTSREDIVDALLQAEMKHAPSKQDPQRLHKYGLICAMLTMLLAFGGIVLFFLLGSDSQTSGGTNPNGRRMLRPAWVEEEEPRPARGGNENGPEEELAVGPRRLPVPDRRGSTERRPGQEALRGAR